MNCLSIRCTYLLNRDKPIVDLQTDIAGYFRLFFCGLRLILPFARCQDSSVLKQNSDTAGGEVAQDWLARETLIKTIEGLKIMILLKTF